MENNNVLVHCRDAKIITDYYCYCTMFNIIDRNNVSSYDIVIVLHDIVLFMSTGPSSSS